MHQVHSEILKILPFLVHVGAIVVIIVIFIIVRGGGGGGEQGVRFRARDVIIGLRAVLTIRANAVVRVRASRVRARDVVIRVRAAVAGLRAVLTAGASIVAAGCRRRSNDCLESRLRPIGPELVEVNVEARHGSPEVPPAPGQHARLHRLPGLEGGHDDVEEAVRQCAQPVVLVTARITAAAAWAGPLLRRLHGLPCSKQFVYTLLPKQKRRGKSPIPSTVLHKNTT
jgi:hypothetical protein